MNLQEEGGVTEISLNNIRKLTSAHGNVKCMLHSLYPEPEDPFTNIYFEDGHVHKATGFSTGYHGTGPSGLVEALDEFLSRNDLDRDLIANLERERPMMYLFTRMRMTCKDKVLVGFPGCMDCEFDVRVY